MLQGYGRVKAGAISVGLIDLAPGADPVAVRDRLRARLSGDVIVMTRDEYIEREKEYWARRTPTNIAPLASVATANTRPRSFAPSHWLLNVPWRSKNWMREFSRSATSTSVLPRMKVSPCGLLNSPGPAPFLPHSRNSFPFRSKMATRLFT